MEELLEVTRKQLKFQKIITACLVVIILLLLVAGVGMTKRMNEMAASIEIVTEKVESLDVDGINTAIASTNEMLESTNEMVKRLGEFYQGYVEMMQEMQNSGDWLAGLFGN